MNVVRPCTLLRQLHEAAHRAKGFPRTGGRMTGLRIKLHAVDSQPSNVHEALMSRAADFGFYRSTFF